MEKKEYPKKLYVYREQDGEDEYLLCFDAPRDAAQIGECRMIGVYELQSVKALKVTIELKEIEAG